MSEKVTTASDQTSDVSSGSSRQPKLQMDTMSREELLLHAKKQLVLLQKVKSRCDEIGLKNSTLEANLRSKESEFAEIKTKYEVGKSERNKILEKFSISEDQNSSLARKVSDLEEQLECTQMKQKTAEATFSCLSDDVTKLQIENKVKKKPHSQLCERQRQDLKEFASKDELWQVERSEFANLKAVTDSELVELKSKYTEREIGLEKLSSEYEQLKEELVEVREAYTMLEASQESLNAEIQKLQTEIETAEHAKKLVEADYETMKAEFESYEAKYQQMQDEMEVMIQENKSRSECGSTEHTDEERDKEAFNCLQSDYDALRNDFHELSLRDKALKQENEEFLEELTDMKERLSALQQEYNLSKEEIEELRYNEALLEAERSAVQLLQRECDVMRQELTDQRSRESFLEAERDTLVSSQQDSDVLRMEVEDLRSRQIVSNVDVKKEDVERLQEECDGLRQELDVLRLRESILEAERNILMSSKQECGLLRHELEEMRCKDDLLMKDRLQTVMQQKEELENERQLVRDRALDLASTLSGCYGSRTTEERSLVDILQDCVMDVENWKEKEQSEVKLMFASVAKADSENVRLEEMIKLLSETLNDLDVKVTALEDVKTVDTIDAVCQTDVEELIASTDAGTLKVDLRDVSTDCDIGTEQSQETVQKQTDKCSDCERLESMFQGKLNQFMASIRMMRTEFVSVASKLKDILSLLKDCDHNDADFIETLEDLEKLILDIDKTKDEDFDGGNATIGDLQKLSNFVALLPNVLRKRIESSNSAVSNSTKEKSPALKEAEETVSKYKIIAVRAKKESAEIKKKLDALNAEISATTKEKSTLEENVRTLGSQLNEERQKHRTTTSKLEQHSNLISLEIADYERHASDLSKQLAEKDAIVINLEKDVTAQREKIQGLQVQIGQLEGQYQQSEERGEQLKSVSVKLRKDIADLQKEEAELKVREGSLLARLESTSQEIENYKVQLSDVSAESQKLQSTNHSMQEAHQKVVRLLETRIGSLTEEIGRIRSEYDDCLSEYESYKVRVHSVLKQQKLKSPTESPSSIEVSLEEKVHLEKAVETLQTRLQELSAQHAAVQTENETLQEEHFNLLQRHNKMAANLAEQESSWRQRLEKLQSELKLEQQEHSELMRHIQLQDETHGLALKKKIDALLEDHRVEVERLTEQLGVIEVQNLKLQRELAQGEMTRNAYRDDEQVVDILNMERQEGEGSEFTDSQKLGLSTSITSFMPLEQLLSQDERTSLSSINTIETEKLEGQLAISTKKIEHLTEILHESEATNARMTEQNRVLKEEIRRLERNQEREKHMANMEYLKNVIVKFISLSAGDEREHLVPVLTTLLRLSPSEEQQITTIARGAVETSSTAAGGWSSYLPMPRWPGTF